MNVTKFEKIYFEPNILEYERGRFLFEKYSNLPHINIESHNNIPELRAYSNKDFTKLKKYLIIGTRKTHKYTVNHKISDFLVPFTSSGCSAICQYCYLVCNYNKCSYLRVFVNKEEILNNLIKISLQNSKNTVYEIGSNSDVILENLVTEDLKDNLNYFFSNSKNGIITFPTKFKYIDEILDIKFKSRLIPRVSLNPEEIITKYEFGTSSLSSRLDAINKLCDSGYKPYILIAPVILTDNYKELYKSLIKEMVLNLSTKAKKNINFEIIFMTYSYIHDKINTDAFPNSKSLYSKELMSSRGVGKYHYKDNVKKDCSIFLQELIKKNFSNYTIKYIV